MSIFTLSSLLKPIPFFNFESIDKNRLTTYIPERLQAFKKCLRLTLVFMWIALNGKSLTSVFQESFAIFILKERLGTRLCL